MQQHYKYAIDTEFNYESVQEQIVEHAVLEYLRNDNEIPFDDGRNLLFYILKTNAMDKWQMTANAFWSRARTALEKIEQGEDVEFFERVLQQVRVFWEWCFADDNAKKRLDSSYSDFLAELGLLICAFDSIEEKTFKQLLKTASCFNDFHRSSHFIEYLNKYDKPSDIEKIGKVYQKMLESYVPTFREEDVKGVVAKLYEVGFRSIADDICNTYGKHGIHFLRELWKVNKI